MASSNMAYMSYYLDSKAKLLDRIVFHTPIWNDASSGIHALQSLRLERNYGGVVAGPKLVLERVVEEFKEFEPEVDPSLQPALLQESLENYFKTKGLTVVYSQPTTERAIAAAFEKVTARIYPLCSDTEVMSSSETLYIRGPRHQVDIDIVIGFPHIVQQSISDSLGTRYSRSYIFGELTEDIILGDLDVTIDLSEPSVVQASPEPEVVEFYLYGTMSDEQKERIPYQIRKCYATSVPVEGSKCEFDPPASKRYYSFYVKVVPTQSSVFKYPAARVLSLDSLTEHAKSLNEKECRLVFGSDQDVKFINWIRTISAELCRLRDLGERKGLKIDIGALTKDAFGQLVRESNARLGVRIGKEILDYPITANIKQSEVAMNLYKSWLRDFARTLLDFKHEFDWVDVEAIIKPFNGIEKYLPSHNLSFATAKVDVPQWTPYQVRDKLISILPKLNENPPKGAFFHLTAEENDDVQILRVLVGPRDPYTAERVGSYAFFCTARGMEWYEKLFGPSEFKPMSKEVFVTYFDDSTNSEQVVGKLSIDDIDDAWVALLTGYLL